MGQQHSTHIPPTPTTTTAAAAAAPPSPSPSAAASLDPSDHQHHHNHNHHHHNHQSHHHHKPPGSFPRSVLQEQRILRQPAAASIAFGIQTSPVRRKPPGGHGGGGGGAATTPTFLASTAAATTATAAAAAAEEVERVPLIGKIDDHGNELRASFSSAAAAAAALPRTSFALSSTPPSPPFLRTFQTAQPATASATSAPRSGTAASSSGTPNPRFSSAPAFANEAAATAGRGRVAPSTAVESMSASSLWPPTSSVGRPAGHVAAKAKPKAGTAVVAAAAAASAASGGPQSLAKSSGLPDGAPAKAYAMDRKGRPQSPLRVEAVANSIHTLEQSTGVNLDSRLAKLQVHFGVGSRETSRCAGDDEPLNAGKSPPPPPPPSTEKGSAAPIPPPTESQTANRRPPLAKPSAGPRAGGSTSQKTHSSRSSVAAGSAKHNAPKCADAQTQKSLHSSDRPPIPQQPQQPQQHRRQSSQSSTAEAENASRRGAAREGRTGAGRVAAPAGSADHIGKTECVNDPKSPGPCLSPSDAVVAAEEALDPVYFLGKE
ncbi:hypothetical protein DFJ73DRAFT_139623 [Zopfochytrium polystomum]|nr:hypothetical protein DFJ73DRAFT_139623 [Zopfochytrium polystomum]